MSDEIEGQGAVGELDETVVVRRPDPAQRQDHPGVEDRSDDADDTVLVRRPPAPAPTPEELDRTRVVRREAGEDALDRTRVVRREAEEDALDRTRVVRREAEEDVLDRTRVVHREAGEDALDRTRVVHRDRDEAPVDATRVVRRDDQPPLERPRTGRWRRAQPVPVSLPSGLPLSERAAEPGVDGVEHYRPRPIPAPPPPAPDLGTGPEATRAPAPAMRSVRRASRRGAWVALGGIVAACAVSVTGLIAIAVAVFSG